MSESSEDQPTPAAWSGGAVGMATFEEQAGVSQAQLALWLRTHQDRIVERWLRRVGSDRGLSAGDRAGPAAFTTVLADVIEGADPALLAGQALGTSGKPAALAEVLDELDALELAALEALAEECGGLVVELVETVTAPVRAAQNVAISDEVARLTAASLEDPLTSLGNRRALSESLARETARTSRLSQTLTVVVVDLDNLKAINDRLGHAAGDQTLKDLAVAVRACLRASDTAFRFGGDEFALLLPGTSLQGVSHLMDRILAVGAPALSWGAASSPEDGVTGDELLAAADRRLYEHRRFAR